MLQVKRNSITISSNHGDEISIRKEDNGYVFETSCHNCWINEDDIDRMLYELDLFFNESKGS